MVKNLFTRIAGLAVLCLLVVSGVNAQSGILAAGANQVLASPAGSNGYMVPRSLVLADLPGGTSGNCLIGAGASSAPAYSACVAALASPLVPSSAGGTTIGTLALPFSSVYIGAAATNNFQVTGTATGTRTVTLPDANTVTVVPTACTNQVATAITGAGAVTCAAVSVAAGGTNLASGTSGGVLAYTASGVLASSAALTANAPMLGGGAGVVPLTVAGINSDGVSTLTVGLAGTSVGSYKLQNATSGTISINPPTGALGTPTVTMPAITGSLLTAYNCGTIAAGGACANTALAGTAHIVQGIATLSGSTSTITGLSPAFTSSSSYFCVANDITTRANPVQAIPASGSTVTFTNTTGATDNISFVCVGN